MSKKSKTNKFWLALVLVVILSLGIAGAALAASPDSKTPTASTAKSVTVQAVTKNTASESAQKTTDISESENVNDVEEPEDAEEPEDSANETTEDAALAGTAKVSESEALATAEKAYPGYTFVSNGLENENGTTVYSLIGTNSGNSIEVKVDAATGSILPEQDGEFEG